MPDCTVPSLDPVRWIPLDHMCIEKKNQHRWPWLKISDTENTENGMVLMFNNVYYVLLRTTE
jgi:hypothetical protein